MRINQFGLPNGIYRCQRLQQTHFARLFVANYLLEVTANTELSTIELATLILQAELFAGSMLMKKENKTRNTVYFYPNANNE